jgi:hypothetical protein
MSNRLLFVDHRLAATRLAIGSISSLAFLSGSLRGLRIFAVNNKDVDRTLLRENLTLTVEERVRKAERTHRSIARRKW